eukprot:9991667-Karenia_brevis.AAC.1
MAICIGGSGERLAEKVPGSNVCPSCQQEGGHDEVHIFCICNALRTYRHPVIVKNQPLVEVAGRDKNQQECTY